MNKNLRFILITLIVLTGLIFIYYAVKGPIFRTNNAGKMGLTENQATVARFRWALFEEWANSRPEYKGWERDEQIFKKAHDAFKKEMEKSGAQIQVIQ